MIKWCDILDKPEYVTRISTSTVYRVIARSWESASYDDEPVIRWFHCIRTEEATLLHADLTPDELRYTDVCPAPEAVHVSQSAIARAEGKEQP